jgi:serine/threonine-protein kinase RsbW
LPVAYSLLPAGLGKFYFLTTPFMTHTQSSQSYNTKQSLTVAGELDSLEAIAEFVMTATSNAGLDKKAAYRFRLAVDEIATNIIVHGYEEAHITGVLGLHAEIDEKTLTMTIEDTGNVYDPNDQTLPGVEDLQKPLEQRQVGGLGVYLALQGVNKFVYERVGDRNHNILIVNR